MRRFLFTLLPLATLATITEAQQKPQVDSFSLEKAIESKEKNSGTSVYDKLWKLAELYNNPENPYIQEVRLQGYFIWNYAYGDSNEGHFGSKDRPSAQRYGDIDFRLWQLGIRVKMFQTFQFNSIIYVNPNFDPEFYDQLYDMNLTWSPNEKFNIGVGKFKANTFSLDQPVSTNRILTFERGVVSSTIFAGELTGAKTYGMINNWTYHAGVYAGDAQREFTRGEAGTFFLGGIGYDFREATGFQRAFIKLDYQFSDDALNAGGGALYDHAFSLNSGWQNGRWTFGTDFMYANRMDGDQALWGINIIPAYNITDKVQAVMRYQYGQAGENGLRVPVRYAASAPDLTDAGRGHEYQAMYFGVNYFIYDHKLKLMLGTEYSSMDGGRDGGDFNGWTTMASLRFFF